MLLSSDLFRRRVRLLTRLVAATLVLAGCGGGGSGGDPPPATETLFVAGNAWQGAAPTPAETLAPDEFRRRVDAGSLWVVTPASLEARRTALRARIEADLQFLESKADLDEDMSALLAEAHAANGFDSAPSATLPDGQTVLFLDLGARIQSAAQTYRLARDPANALAVYRLSHALLSDAVKAVVPAPDSLRDATRDQIALASQQLEAALKAAGHAENARLDPNATAASGPTGGALRKATAVVPGNGNDNNGLCTPRGHAYRYWFPLRNFVSPVKSQGARGTCWAFTAIASIESRERVQNNNSAYLSEQFLINKFTHEWMPNDYGDGGFAVAALNHAWAGGQALMNEAQWTYNPATGLTAASRAPGAAGSVVAYEGTCTGYSGSCWTSSHETPRSCTTVFGLTFCGFEKQVYDGPGVKAGQARVLWSKGSPFNLQTYTDLLAHGVSLMASLPVYDGFVSVPSTGIVSVYDQQYHQPDGTVVAKAGDHAVQIVGFIDNEAMSFPGAPPSNVAGGGRSPVSMSLRHRPTRTRGSAVSACTRASARPARRPRCAC